MKNIPPQDSQRADGKLPESVLEAKYGSTAAENVMIDTVKCAEDGTGNVIVRLYECSNTMTKCALNVGFPIKAAYLTDMPENVKSGLPISNGKISFGFGGFKVITVRLVK